ncbi:helix-turn-helix domain-containing protein [Paenibacillus sp. JDR-2]|uniref:helix-turn-helix domain-containing protein n=1 Tax=Paenibacillus sp. (strain JDR-2) TaxID=324057 RepID=UPI000166B1E9|nr:AraC family transcriptional regulator [Paenibacillus sp. JDR-2]ACS99020.1 transcriptional regulator, AraC family [Paenibacillus sp. JDR-2]
MAQIMDYMISSQPLRMIDLTVDPAKLSVRSLVIRNVGYLPGRTHFRQGAVFQYWAIVYIAGGSGTYRVDHGEAQRVTAGSLFLFQPGFHYDYGPDPGGYWDEYYFTIEGTRYREWLEHWPILPNTVMHPGEDASSQNRIDRIFALMDSGTPADADRAALTLESLLYDWVQSCQSSPAAQGKTARLAQLLEALSGTLHEPFDAAAFAERHHWALSTLRRTVSEYTGFALHEYVHRLKMAEAKNRLLNTEQTVKEIAAALGYGDVFYFSRLFKKITGEAPRLFRRNMRSK